MNKLTKIAAVATIGLTLTGCGNGKKITCSYTENNSFSGNSEEKITYVYDKSGKNIEKFIETKSEEYTEKSLKYYDKDLEDILESAEEDCEKYEDSEVATCTAKLKGNKITQTITYNIKGIDEDDLEEMYDDEDITYLEYSIIKGLLKNDYEDIVKDSQDDDNSLFKYNCK